MKMHEIPKDVDKDEVYFGDFDIRINLGMSTCGQAAGADALQSPLDEILNERGVKAKVVNVGCIGSCYAEPLMEIIHRDKPGVLYSSVTPDLIGGMLDSYLRGDISNAFAIRSRSGAFKDENSVPVLKELPFFKYQVRDAIENCGIIDPESLEEYIAFGGYRGLERALKELTPDELIEEISESGLRGRGGAGFPTGLKWRFTRDAAGDKKYAICNADEGDPGAFMNRLNAEGDPHKILEGLITAAYAIGADEGYFFVRAEKPLMAERFKKAIEAAREGGLLGENILDSGFDFDANVVLSAGAFVCGEETAMMAAIEGNRAMPRPRPPFPATEGLWGKPTVINNVETLAHVPKILTEGPAEFAKVGSEKSKGTKVFCLTGKIKRTGAVEVPLGTTLKRLVIDIGGGPPNNKDLKAVQTGGPSGGCIPARLMDLPLDYESLQEAGTIMGSGGVVVMDEDTCLVDVANYFLSFTTAESCGKCTPCRIGLKRMRDILSRITQGDGREGDYGLLRDLSKTIAEASLCGLGRTAPNPVLTTLRYFMDEYQAHIEEGVCPAGVCVDLSEGFQVNPKKCQGCGRCVDECPVDAITMIEDNGKIAQIDDELCIQCGQCEMVCPFDAIERRW